VAARLDAFTLEPVRNSDLNRFRAEILQLPPVPAFVNRYLRFGTLVDALITEPARFDWSKLMLSHTSRYDDMNYYFSEQDAALAQRMRDAYLQHPLISTIHAHGGKYDFTPQVIRYCYENRFYLAKTGGEMDDYAGRLCIGVDIKCTAAKTLKEFMASFHKFNYGQQGSFYMDSMELHRYLFVGISRKAVDTSTGLPALFIVPLTRQSALYQEGKDSYSYWMGRYLAGQNMLIEA